MNQMAYIGPCETVAHRPPQGGRRTAIRVAWAVEGMAIAMGLVLAVYSAIEGGETGFLPLFVAALPFAALSVVELTKIPLVAAASTTASWSLRAIALAALLCVTFATFENFVFGFERGFNERLRRIAAADEQVRGRTAERDLAGRALADLQARLADTTQSAEGLRRDAEASRQQARADLADTNSRAQGVEAALGGQRDRAQQALAAAQAALARCGDDPNCRAVRNRAAADARAALNRADAALSQRLAATDGDQRETRQRRDEAVAKKDAAVAEREQEIAAIRGEIAEAQAGLNAAERAASEAASERASLLEKSQLHRLAMVLFNSQDDAAVATTKKWFVGSLAAIVALIGTVLAALHYAPQREPPGTASTAARKGTINRAVRGYLARRRKARSAAPAQRLKLVYVPLAATEAQVAEIRRKTLATEDDGEVPAKEAWS